MELTRPFYQVEATLYTGKNDGKFRSRQAWIYFYPRGGKNRKDRVLCARYAFLDADLREVSVDASTTIGFKPSGNWVQVPVEVIMEFFLVLFEKELEPQSTGIDQPSYIGSRYYYVE